MTLTTIKKSWLNNNTSLVLKSFNIYKSQKSYMAVYSMKSKPYCTFSNTNNFSSTISIGREEIDLICVYITANDFTMQTNIFLS